jgi:hypothetical protein
MSLVKFANNNIEITDFNGALMRLVKFAKNKNKNILHVAHKEVKKNKKSPSSSSCGSLIQSFIELGYMKI